MQSKIDERQILEGIPEHKKKEMMLDHSKPRQIRPARSADYHVTFTASSRLCGERKVLILTPPPCRPAPTKTLVRQSSIMLPGTRPKTHDHVVTWFRENEAPRGRCKEKDGSISLWFHGG